MSLPTLQEERLRDIGKVLINTKYLLSSPSMKRYHITKKKKATKPKIAETIKEPELRIKEMKRQRAVRERLVATNSKNTIDIDMDHDIEDEIDCHSESDEDINIPISREALKEHLLSLNFTELKVKCQEKGLKRSGGCEQLRQRLLDPDNPVHKRNV